MKTLVRGLVLAAAVFAVATAANSIGSRTDRSSGPYAPALSLAGVEEAHAARPPWGPGCQRACSSTGCVYIANRGTNCAVVSPESCVEEACQ